MALKIFLQGNLETGKRVYSQLRRDAEKDLNQKKTTEYTAWRSHNQRALTTEVTKEHRGKPRPRLPQRTQRPQRSAETGRNGKICARKEET